MYVVDATSRESDGGTLPLNRVAAPSEVLSRNRILHIEESSNARNVCRLAIGFHDTMWDEVNLREEGHQEAVFAVIQ